jgi:hypothetical protein
MPDQVSPRPRGKIRSILGRESRTPTLGRKRQGRANFQQKIMPDQVSPRPQNIDIFKINLRLTIGL